MAEQLPPLKRKSRPKGRASILAGPDTTNVTTPAEAATAESSPSGRPPETPESAPTPATGSRAIHSGSDEKVQLGVKVGEELKGRARAAFKEAAYHEDVTTFHQFVSQALEAEIRRIEITYNDGHRLEPRSGNLRRGRPAL